MTLPLGFIFYAHGASGSKWKTTAQAITLETPSGPIEIAVVDGIPTIRSFNMQGNVAAGGPDNTVRFEFLPVVASPITFNLQTSPQAAPVILNGPDATISPPPIQIPKLQD